MNFSRHKLASTLGIIQGSYMRLDIFLQVIWEDLAYAVIFLELTLMWRGTWNLLVYLLPDPEVGGWVCHILGAIIFFCMEVRLVTF